MRNVINIHWSQLGMRRGVTAFFPTAAITYHPSFRRLCIDASTEERSSRVMDANTERAKPTNSPQRA